MIEVGKREFTIQDQIDFAWLSGDSNPVHVDPAAARRTLFGSPVVHGVHGVLWAIGCYLRSSGRRGVATLDARFVRSASLNKTIRCIVEREDASRALLRLESDDGTISRIDLTFSGLNAPDTTVTPSAPLIACHDRAFGSAGNASGELPLFLDATLAKRLLPSVSGCVSGVQLAGILATTRLVGMEMPGLHSIFTRLRLTFDVPAGTPSLKWRVLVADPRFASVRMSVSGPGMIGDVQAFFRPAPRAQIVADDVSARVDSQEFFGHKAVIIGGSRGLGEAAAKLIATGGGEVCLTYLAGEADAKRVCSELGDRAQSVRFDAGRDTLPVLPWMPTHLYFFATPYIGASRSASFSTERFEGFSRIYVSGFARTVTALAELNPAARVLYPSTVFLDDPSAGFAEYCAAKIAGERVCAHLRSIYPNLSVQAPRLPRVATDQTAGLRADQTADAFDVLLPLIRQLG